MAEVLNIGKELEEMFNEAKNLDPIKTMDNNYSRKFSDILQDNANNLAPCSTATDSKFQAMTAQYLFRLICLTILLRNEFTEEDIRNAEFKENTSLKEQYESKMKGKYYEILNEWYKKNPIRFMRDDIISSINDTFDEVIDPCFYHAKKFIDSHQPKNDTSQKNNTKLFKKYRGRTIHIGRKDPLGSLLESYRKLIIGGAQTAPFGTGMYFPYQFGTTMAGGADESPFTDVIKDLFNKLSNRLENVHLKISSKDNEALGLPEGNTGIFKEMKDAEKNIYKNFKALAEFTKKARTTGARGVGQDIEISELIELNKSIKKYSDYEMKLRKPMEKMISKLTEKSFIESRLNNDINSFLK